MGAPRPAPRPRGYDWLERNLFYTQSPDIQVTPRRRKVSGNNTQSIPANGSFSFGNQVTMDAADNLKVGDGILFDYAALQFNTTVFTNAIACVGAFLSLLDQLSHIAGIANTWNTTFVAGGAATLSSVLLFEFDDWARLWTVQDINAAMFQGSTGSGLANQPLIFQSIGIYTNNTAGALNVTSFLTVFYRIVRGLQEG